MLCPEGYVTIPDILDMFPDSNFEGMEVAVRLKSARKERLIFQALLKNKAPRICLPDGTILKIHHEILDMVSLSDVFFCAKIPNANFAGLNSSVDFWASCHNPEIGLPLFFTRPYYLLSLENYKALKVAVDKALPKDYNQDDIWAATGLPFEFDPMWPVVSKFEGAILCAVSDKIPKKISFPNPDETKELFAPRKVGRPRKQEKALEIYRQVFPDGHGNLSWKEVLLKINQVDPDVKIDTLKRAVGKK